MSLRSRMWVLGVALAALIPLVALSIFAPPDGGERAEFAQFLGRFHPLLVHLPIALILLVAVLELVGSSRDHLRRAAGFVLALATIAAFVTAGFGWLLAWSGGFEGALVMRHMWGGVVLAAMCVGCWNLQGRKHRVYPLALMATVGLMVWTSDQGGKLTHGSKFLTERMPQPLARWVGIKERTKADPSSFYVTRVQPIFDQKCVLCHNAEKFKGKLRLDTYEDTMLGGKDGPVIRPREPGKSELLRRVTLSLDNKDFMPADGKPALSAAETRVLEVWIAAGAGVQIADSAVKELSPPFEEKKAPPLTGDYRPQLQTIASLEASLGVRLVPRSQNPTDGLTLRTVTAPGRCNDTVLDQLAPVANLIVDAELARTQVTDKGMQALGSFSNLRFLDLSDTRVTAAGVRELLKLEHLESLNLTHTKVKSGGLSGFEGKTGLKLYLFESQ